MLVIKIQFFEKKFYKTSSFTKIIFLGNNYIQPKLNFAYVYVKKIEQLEKYFYEIMLKQARQFYVFNWSILLTYT